MNLRITALLAIFFANLAGTIPAFSQTAYGNLNSATRNAERTFHGAGVYANGDSPTMPGAKIEPGTAQAEEEIVITATRKQNPVVKAVKKAAPYAFAAGVGLWIGLALTGGAIFPALAVAAVVVLLFMAAK